MHRRLLPRPLAWIPPYALALLLTALCAACSKETDEGIPVATPSVTVAAREVPIGSPVDITYKFVVAANAPQLAKNYRVFVHFNDASGQQLWTDDHLPPTPTSEWKAGRTVEYTRTMFVPRVPYTGETTIDLGLYEPVSDERVPLAGTVMGRRAYRVGTLNVRPQAETTLVLFRSGWHDAEVVPDSPGIEWRWSKELSTLQFRNPKRDIVLMLDLDQPQADLTGSQRVELRAEQTPLDAFSLKPGERTVRRVAVPAAALGNSDNVELTLVVSPTFSPAYLPGATSKDVRTLGVRVLNVYIQPK
jgi:hypothetical protein